MINSKNSKLLYIKQNFINIFIISLALAVFISCYIFINTKPIGYPKDVWWTLDDDSTDLKLFYEKRESKKSNSINSNGFIKLIVSIILILPVLIIFFYVLTLIKDYNMPLYEKTKTYIYIGKIYFILLLFVLTGLIIPGFYYIYKIESLKLTPDTKLQLTKDSGLVFITLSFLLVFISLVTLIYFRKSELK